MTIKDFLLGLNEDKICETYYEMYYKNNEVEQAKASKDGYDLKEHIFALVKHFIDQIKYIEPKTDTAHKALVIEYADFDLDDDLNIFKTKCLDAFVINLSETKDRGQLKRITSLDNTIQDVILSNYSFMMIPWEEALGYELCYLHDDKTPLSMYMNAAALIYEITFFGYDKERYDNTVADEKEKLDEAIKEIEEGNTTKYIEADIYKELDLPTPTKEQKEKERQIHKELAIENYNITISVYNYLQARGLFNNNSFENDVSNN